jgi:hypothetical protein
MSAAYILSHRSGWDSGKAVLYVQAVLRQQILRREPEARPEVPVESSLGIRRWQLVLRDRVRRDGPAQEESRFRRQLRQLCGHDESNRERERADVSIAFH